MNIQKIFPIQHEGSGLSHSEGNRTL